MSCTAAYRQGANKGRQRGVSFSSETVQKVDKPASE